MPWKPKQIQLQMIACRNAGIDDDMRKLILRQFPNAMFDAQGKRSDQPSSRSEKLENRDFEQFMAVIEDRAGGHLRGFDPGYWQHKAGIRSTVASERQAAKIHALYQDYRDQDEDGGRYRLEGLVYRFSGQRTSDVEQLQPMEAWNLIEMLKHLIEVRPEAKRRDRERQAKLFSDREAEPHPLAGTTATVHHPLNDDEIPF